MAPRPLHGAAAMRAADRRAMDTARAALIADALAVAGATRRHDGDDERFATLLVELVESAETYCRAMNRHNRHDSDDAA